MVRVHQVLITSLLITEMRVVSKLGKMCLFNVKRWFNYRRLNHSKKLKRRDFSLNLTVQPEIFKT